MFSEPDVTFGVQTLRLLIVNDAVGLQSGVAVIDLDVADGGNAVVGIVVVDLGRLNEHLLLPGLFALKSNLGFFRRRRPRWKRQFLCRRRDRRNQSATGQQAEDSGNYRDATAIQPRP